MRVDVVGSPLAVHRARRELEGPFPAGPNLDRVPQLALRRRDRPPAFVEQQRPARGRALIDRQNVARHARP